MLKNVHIWLPAYVAGGMRRCCRKDVSGKKHIFFTVTDHFEPKWGNPDKAREAARVQAWSDQYPVMARKHQDSGGRHPQHCFFYPYEEYEPEYLEALSSLCRQGFGEVEIHLHHDNDTEDNFRSSLEHFKELLVGHGLLARNAAGEVRYGFIHGNWSLANSRPDGRWCGIDNELDILQQTGCYGDFTLPSAPSDTQTRKINSIYYADDLSKRKAHDTGKDSQVGNVRYDDLVLLQGPLALNWSHRKWGIVPRIENGELTAHNLPTQKRTDLWVQQEICVQGKPDWIFIKTHTHGAQDEHVKPDFFAKLDAMYQDLEERYNDGTVYQLHYVSTRQMANLVHAAEAGLDGDPELYLDSPLVSNIKVS